MRFLVCGLGSIGRRHLRNLRELGEREIGLLRSGKSTLPEDELAGLPTWPDLAQALHEFEPDAVLVTNPTALHLEVAIPAARAGCHLLVEKPLSHSLAGVPELTSALEQGGGRLLMGFNYRYHPGLQRLRETVRQGVIGETVAARAHWGEYLPDWHPWEDYRDSYSSRTDLGGGVLLTLSHPFDYLRWILGEVLTVSGEISSAGPLELQVETVAEVTLRHDNAALSSVHLDYLQRPRQHSLQIIGSRGTIEWEAATGTTRWWADGRWSEAEAPDGYERNHMFLHELRHFIDVVENAAEPACTLADGVRALEIALAARAAAESGAAVQLERAELVQ